MGIYVHIPFCRSKCYYCGFYSVASTQLKKAYIAALGRDTIAERLFRYIGNKDTLFWGRYSLMVEYG